MNNINNNDSKSNEKKSDVKNVNSKQTKLTWKKVYTTFPSWKKNPILRNK